MASMASAGLAGSRGIADAIGRSRGSNSLGREGSGDRTLGGGIKSLKPKKKGDTTSGTTGDPDNPNLDELREGIYEPVEERFPVQGGRRRRKTVLTEGDAGRFSGVQKTLLGQ